ncbi:uncharacterized protein LOC124373356 [Homalodisca vitripennis]|uniref:uncharacterized protein LOC124373356 n=1 Tax=Homalodisca vitripennis TaxID=197043 RepID=UPI001EEA29B5|nr:uncharacterized protein LOC124373356 [Homalodisca vitripennis]
MVQTTRAAKYLGVLVDNKLTWREQIFRTADKASKMVTHLSRLMANVGGPKPSRRRLLMSAVQSRQAALRVCSAYRTVSEPAVLVIAGVIPIKLLAGERKVDTVCNRMLEGEDYWCCLSSFAQGILRAKKSGLDRNPGQIQDPNG